MRQKSRTIFENALEMGIASSMYAQFTLAVRLYFIVILFQMARQRPRHLDSISLGARNKYPNSGKCADSEGIELNSKR